MYEFEFETRMSLRPVSLWKKNTKHTLVEEAARVAAAMAAGRAVGAMVVEEAEEETAAVATVAPLRSM